MNQKRPNRILHLLAACGLLALCSLNTRANSYASSLTNNAGEVSFRLNDSADSVKVKGNGGALTVDLGPLPRGLTVTNLTSRGLTAGAFEVTVVKVGTGVPSLIGSSVAFNSPRGVAVNSRPGSPYFGRVYVANSAASATVKGDGIFTFASDLSDILNRGTNAATGGLNFTTGTTSSPYRLKVGRDDDQVYVTDWSDGTGNLYVFDPDLTTAGYALKQLTGSASVPVGAANFHGSVAAVEVLGRTADGNLRIFTIDEDYQSDPTSSAQAEDNSLWEYDAGAGPLPWTNAPNLKLLTPTINFVSQTMDLSYSPGSGYFYVSELRSAGNEAGVFIVDTNATLLFNSRTKSAELFGSVDVLANLQGVAASPDGKWLATVNNNNVVTIVPMTDGIPDLTQRFQYTGFATTTSARGIAFDVANNIYVVSSGLGTLQSISAGFTATNTTTSAGVFTQTTPSTAVSGILLDPETTITNVLMEATASQFATFKIVRTNDDFSSPLSVNFTLAGTATRGTASTGDYYIRTNGVVITNSTIVTIPTGADSILLDVVANDDNISELTETIIFSVSGGAYNTRAPLGDTITIVDNDLSMVDISAVTFNTAFEGNTNDFIRYTLTRRGDTNLGSFTVNLGYAGTATKDVDYTSIPNITFDPGVITQTVDIHPLNDSIIETNQTVVLSVTPGTGYLVGTNGALTAAATGTIMDDDQPDAAILFADDFTSADDASNWTILFGSNDPTTQNYIANFGYDYSALGVPPAPHSTNSDTFGLMLSVNKNTDLGAAAGLAAGVDLYPNAKNFTGNYALRFDMYLMQNGSSATTEYAMFGINHDATHTNWFNNSANMPAGWTFDGLFAYVEADGSQGLADGEYVLYTAPARSAGGNPSVAATRPGSAFTGIYHNPPYSSGGTGVPANTPSTTTPSWAQVEFMQIGNLNTLKINNTTIFSITNTTAFKSGNIMLGYDDAYNSIGAGGGGLVIYDNVRVVRLASGIHIDNISQTGTNLTMNFTGFENEAATAYKLVSSTNVVGPYTDDATAGITTVVVDPAAATYRVTTSSTAGLTNAPATKFYMIRRVP